MTRYFPEAETELNEAAQFYEDRQRGLGQDFLDAVDAAIVVAIAHLSRQPSYWIGRV